MENKTYVICHDNIVETYDYSQHTEFVERLRELQEEFDNKGRILMCPQGYISNGNYLQLYRGVVTRQLAKISK